MKMMPLIKDIYLIFPQIMHYLLVFKDVGGKKGVVCMCVCVCGGGLSR